MRIIQTQYIVLFLCFNVSNVCRASKSKKTKNIFSSVIKNEVSTGQIRYVIKTLFPSFLEGGFFMRWNYFFAPSLIKSDGFVDSG